MKAVYAGNYIRKEGEQKGKTFHIYTIKGTVEEIKQYINSPQFKQYPRKSATGEPQLHTMYMDAFRDELPLYLKQDGNFTLDQSETRKDVARLEMLEQTSSVLASAFANRLADKVFGAGKVSSSTANSFIPEPVATGDDATLNEDL
ncbi:MAG: hypothetical protein RLZZ196_286 [Bacteroidota bacterium]|jgi:hypothetical protein